MLGTAESYRGALPPGCRQLAPPWVWPPFELWLGWVVWDGGVQWGWGRRGGFLNVKVPWWSPHWPGLVSPGCTCLPTVEFLGGSQDAPQTSPRLGEKCTSEGSPTLGILWSPLEILAFFFLEGAQGVKAKVAGGGWDGVKAKVKGVGM